MTERDELAHAIYKAWMDDERWWMDLAVISQGKPLAFFWAEVAARAARTHGETIKADEQSTPPKKEHADWCSSCYSPGAVCDC